MDVVAPRRRRRATDEESDEESGAGPAKRVAVGCSCSASGSSASGGGGVGGGRREFLAIPAEGGVSIRMTPEPYTHRDFAELGNDMLVNAAKYDHVEFIPSMPIVVTDALGRYQRKAAANVISFKRWRDVTDNIADAALVPYLQLAFEAPAADLYADVREQLLSL